MLFTYYFPGLGVDSVFTYHNCRVGELGGFSSKLEEILLFLLRDARDMRNHSLFINYFSNYILIILVRLYLIFLQYAFINFVINSTELRHNSIHLNLISEFSIVQIQTSACHISTVVGVVFKVSSLAGNPTTLIMNYARYSKYSKFKITKVLTIKILGLEN